MHYGIKQLSMSAPTHKQMFRLAFAAFPKMFKDREKCD